MSKCERKDCKYHARPEAIGTCDYRAITGHGRGCSIEDCVVYDPGERENRQKAYNPAIPWLKPKPIEKEQNAMDNQSEFKSVVPPAKTDPPPPKVERPQMPQDSSARKKWYDTVFAEIDKGRDIDEVAAEFGITARQIKQSRGRRIAMEKKAKKKEPFTLTPEAEPIPPPAEEPTAAPPDEKPMDLIDEAAASIGKTIYKAFESSHNPTKEDMKMWLHGLVNDRIIDDAFSRIQTIVNAVKLSDSRRMKVAAVLVVAEIINSVDEIVGAEDYGK